MKSYCILLGILTALLPIQGLRAEPQELFGEVKIEEFKNSSSGSYAEQQNSALSLVQHIENSQTANSIQGELQADNKNIFYLTGLYLYCLQKSGDCPFVLDTVLVSDYYLNRQDRQGCTNMKKLWRNWIDNGYEQRVTYLIPLALSQKFNNFQQNKRPAYLKCDETLKSFSPDADTLKSIRMTKKFIEHVKEKNINIFHESGALNVDDRQNDKQGGKQKNPGK